MPAKTQTQTKHDTYYRVLERSVNFELTLNFLFIFFPSLRAASAIAAKISVALLIPASSDVLLWCRRLFC